MIRAKKLDGKRYMKGINSARDPRLLALHSTREPKTFEKGSFTVLPKTAVEHMPHNPEVTGSKPAGN